MENARPAADASPAEADPRLGFAETELGPAIADYLGRLLAFCRQFDETRGGQVLFATRAGLRIRRALAAYAQARGETIPDRWPLFWVSRLMAAKGVWRRTPDATVALLETEFRDKPLFALFDALRRSADAEDAPFDLGDPALFAPVRALPAFLRGDHSAARWLVAHLEEQAGLFERQIRALVPAGGPDPARALLVDTGWQGTTQTLLTDAFPEIEWSGAYFGRYGAPGADRRCWDRVVGLVFETEGYDPRRPQTCVVEHRHMIEALFEPRAPSVERLAEGPGGAVVAPAAEAILADAPTPLTDPLFAGVMRHLEDPAAAAGPAAQAAAAAAAWRSIAVRAATPTREDVALFAAIERSADFGRTLRLPLVHPPEPREDAATPAERVAAAIWPAGQIAVEYPPEIALPLQRRRLGTLAAPAAARDPEDGPAVAVITRTLDRPLFLRRALASVGGQTFRDYVHVVISDGGDFDLVRRVAAEADIDHGRLVLVDAVTNRGMEAASNLAIAHVRSRHVVIHDDDDSWAPTFLERTVGFLDGSEGAPFGGVISHTIYVSEEVTPEGVVEHARRPYQAWVRNVSLMEMAVGNFFPPIAFLFRRSVYDALGGFDERYPVLGDWDFNLRFLTRAEIGVLPEPLAHYHHRDRGDTRLFGNSVISGVDKHVTYATIVRNEFVRRHADAAPGVLATAATMALHIGELRALGRETRAMVEDVRARLERT